MPHIPFTEFGKDDKTITSTLSLVIAEKVNLPSPSFLFGTVDYTTVYVSHAVCIYSACIVLVTFNLL